MWFKIVCCFFKIYCIMFISLIVVYWPTFQNSLFVFCINEETKSEIKQIKSKYILAAPRHLRGFKVPRLRVKRLPPNIKWVILTQTDNICFELFIFECKLEFLIFEHILKKPISFVTVQWREINSWRYCQMIR